MIKAGFQLYLKYVISKHYFICALLNYTKGQKTKRPKTFIILFVHTQFILKNTQLKIHWNTKHAYQKVRNLSTSYFGVRQLVLLMPNKGSGILQQPLILANGAVCCWKCWNSFQKRSMIIGALSLETLVFEQRGLWNLMKTILIFSCISPVNCSYKWNSQSSDSIFMLKLVRMVIPCWVHNLS